MLFYLFFSKNIFLSGISLLSFFFLAQKNNLMLDFFLLNVMLFWMCISFFFLMKNLIFNKKFFFLFVLNVIFSILFFFSKSYFLIYIFFEFSLLPIFLIIIFWGYQLERIQAGFFMMYYTLFFSIPGFISIILILKMSNFIFIQPNLILFFFCMFFVKIPIFGLHVWLPKAHVEAPTVGSIILAAILLKLGGFGVLKFSIFFQFSILCLMIFKILSIMGFSLATLICFLQTDMKSIIAYSSVIHMNFIIFVYFFNFLSNSVLCLMFLSHAFISGGMFFLSGSLFYKNKSRKIWFSNLIKNLSYFIYIFIIIFFVMNFSPPPFLSFVTESLPIFTIFMLNTNFAVLLFFFVLLSSFFCIFVLSKFGVSWKNEKNSLTLNKNNIFIYIFFIFCNLPSILVFF